MVDKVRPLKMIVLSLTGRCNFACRYCYAVSHSKKTMDIEIALRAINLAAKDKMPFLLQFSGGEPFLAFEVMREVALYVRKHGIPAVMRVQTNASLLDENKCNFLKEAKIGLGVSFDGRPYINDRLRRLLNGEGTTAEVMRGVRLLQEAGIEIGVTCVVTEENADKLTGIIEMAFYMGNVRRIGFDLLRGQGLGKNMKPPDPEKVAEGIWQALEASDQLSKSTGRKIIVSQLERVENLAKKGKDGFGHCYAMNGEAAFVDAEGRIYACSSLVGLDEFLLGNVWEGINFKKQQKVMNFILQSMEFCLKCPDFRLCGGGCFARWYGFGVEGEPYEGECALKRACIKWFQHCKKRSGEN